MNAFGGRSRTSGPKRGVRPVPESADRSRLRFCSYYTNNLAEETHSSGRIFRHEKDDGVYSERGLRSIVSGGRNRGALALGEFQSREVLPIGLDQFLGHLV